MASDQVDNPKRTNRAAGLPLLVRELTEQAAKKRTWLLRGAYAGALFLVSCIFLADNVQIARNDPLGMLGKGYQLFEVVMYFQLIGIHLLLPTLASSSITAEKERNTLGLLLVTKLKPWTIILEKVLAHSMPMLYFTLLSLPILAIAFALGGIGPNWLANSIWLLGLAILQVASFSLMCSALTRNTASAFICTVLVALLVFFGTALVVVTLDELRILRNIHRTTIFGSGVEWPFLGCTFYLYGEHARGMQFWQMLVLSIPAMVSIVVALVIARVALVRYAFASGTPTAKRFLVWADAVLRGGLRRLDVQHLLPARDQQPPHGEPIIWRDEKTILGNLRYQLYFAGALTAFVIFWRFLLDYWTGIGSRGGRSYYSDIDFTLVLLHWGLWIVCLLWIIVKGTSLFAGERTSETLDSLLTTPLTNKEILRQKLYSLRRFTWLMAIPAVTLVQYAWWWRWSIIHSNNFRRMQHFSPTCYLIILMICVLTLVPVVTWLSVWFGLRSKTLTRAIFGTMLTIITWCILPFLLIIPFFAYFDVDHDSLIVLALGFSPLTPVILNEVTELDDMGPSLVLWIMVLPLLYGSVLLKLRSLCMNNLDKYLNRNDQVGRAIPVRPQPVAGNPLTGSQPGTVS